MAENWEPEAYGPIAKMRSGRRSPRDPRNAWRVIDAQGVWREVASADNAYAKAAAYDLACPERERPHRVEHWNGVEWVRP